MALFAHETGEGTETVVLLHGFGGSHAVWRPMQALLSAQARVIAYDLPGHGRSAAFPDAGPPKLAAEAVLADLAEKGIDGVHLVGHSMGGAVAAIAAMSAPGRVASLTMLAPGGFGPEINHRLLTRFAAAADAAGVLVCLEAMFGYLAPVPDGLAVTLVEERRANANGAILQRIAAGLVRDGRQGQLPRERLAALPMPVRLAWGDLDAVLPARQAHDVPANVVVRRFPDLGHMLPEEAPEEMAGLVRDAMAAAR